VYVDSGAQRLYASHTNQTEVIDLATGKGMGKIVFNSNGRYGTVTVVSGDKFDVVQTVTTEKSARTIGADPKTHKLYLPAAEQVAATVGKDGKQGRPGIVPDSFMLVVVGK
jgi:DNA-binding beta-propeller fold protein YncE